LEHFLHFIKDLKQTGAIAPSSKFLAKDLVEQLRTDVSRSSCTPLKILEIGPGTGPLTKEIVKLLRPQDRLDVVEIHQHFYQTIKNKFKQPNVTIHHEDILQFRPEFSYDYIFSSLPYEAMPKKLIQKIWQKKLDLCADKAYICYFKYVSFRKFKCNFEEQIVKRYQRDKKIVLLNLPPAKLFTLEINGYDNKSTFFIEHVA
jgi:phospholipid N-methyltransferase